MSRDPLRVVFVTTVFEAVDTGPGIYAQYLWRLFRDDTDIEFHVVAPEFREVHPRLHPAGAAGNSLNLYRRVQELGLAAAREGNRPAIVHGNSTHSMGRFVRYEGPLLVQVNDYETALFPSQIARMLRHGGPRRIAAMAWRRYQEKRVLRSVDLALCNSSYTAEIVRRAYGLEAVRCRVLHKAVDTSDFERPSPLPPDPLGLVRPGRRIIFLGSDWRRKGLDVLLEALGRSRSRLPPTVLVAVGPDPHDADLRRRVTSGGLDDCVVLPGRLARSAVAAHLWHADLLVLPSRREALGVALLEGMAAGLPVVATQAGGIPELVRPGVEGLLVPPDDPAELAAAIGRVLTDQRLGASMGAAGIRRAAEFSMDSMGRTLREIYGTVGRRAGPVTGNAGVA